MYFCKMDLSISIIFLVISVLLYFYWSVKKAHRFFLDRKIPYIKPHLLFGNMKDVILMRTTFAEIYQDLYKKLAPHHFGGVFTFTKPTIVIRDPVLIKHIIIKDFAFFTDRGFNTIKEIDPLKHHLFMMRGDEWKNLRIKLTGTFTTGKMKMMFPLVKQCGEKLFQIIDQIPYDETFDVKDLFSRYTTDAIGSCAFGLETNSLDYPDSEFRLMGKKAFSFRYAKIIRALWPNMPKKLIKLFKLTLIDENVENYFMQTVDNTVKYREQNNVTRNDFLDLLIALKNNPTSQKFHDAGDGDLQKFLEQINNKCMKSDVDMNNQQMAALAFVFFTVGYETASITLSNVFLELSLNEIIQDKTRQEIQDVLSSHNGQMTYEVLKKMNYTDMVIDETLRKWPPTAMLFRECGENYQVPNSEIVIPAQTSIVIPIYGIHKDEKYYDNPEEFRPERFSDEEKSKRPNYTYLPFGDGPRVCIAERFAKMLVKVGLVYALKDFSYRVSPKMKFPLEFRRSIGMLGPQHGILLQRQRL